MILDYTQDTWITILLYFLSHLPLQ